MTRRKARGQETLASGLNVTVVGLEKVKAALRGWEDDFEPGKRQVRVLFGRIGRVLRDDVRDRISSQGDGGSWKKLSKWTRARTGRRKALITERSRVTYIVKPRRLEIAYAERSSQWNLTKHHHGFQTPGFRGKKAVIPLRNPGPLGAKGNALTIFSAKPSVVPARPIWTPETKLLRIVNPITRVWVNQQLSKRA